MPSQLVVMQKQQPNQVIPSKVKPELKRNETKRFPINREFSGEEDMIIYCIKLPIFKQNKTNNQFFLKVLHKDYHVNNIMYTRNIWT
jgi:hypothetical protein